MYRRMGKKMMSKILQLKSQSAIVADYNNNTAHPFDTQPSIEANESYVWQIKF